MSVVSSYVLEIPDLDIVLKQADVARWELFLLNAANGYEKISWKVSESDGCYTFRNVPAFAGHLKSVKIDFKAKQIIFLKGEMSDENFKDFVDWTLEKMFLRINSNQMHFVVSPKYSLQR